ncbi:hypothetical protein GCM10027176_48370 [Actinoallomurus bryophytorum]|uniref:DUF6458 domain-containing protein n=1 Tax=Actinoallomurus bryophytorum TaxID=1490222 RepID=A0A543CKD7_9ACTN|nr:DUF6458 family protein [Actinoallomurus bryophytorum]TQL97539.1 hypothetical protein FB559_3130 [Actinoallomurus bryophytorum]
MGIGTGLVLVALGAILAFATNFSLSGVDVQMVGWILIVVGIAMLVITLAYTRPRARRRSLVRDVDVVDGEPQPGAYMRKTEVEEPVAYDPIQPGPNPRHHTQRRITDEREI